VSGRWTVPPVQGPLVFKPADRGDKAGSRAVVFLDRDGVLNEGVRDPETGFRESPLTVADVRLLPSAVAALGKLADAGYALVCVSNQPAAAKGKVTVKQLLAVHERVLELLASDGVRLDASLLCPHHPQGLVAELSGACDCRKPAPGMLLDAADALGLDLARSWMLGDTDADMAAGKAAGSRTVLIEYPGSTHKRSGEASPDLRAGDLSAAVAQLLGLSAVKSEG
jgi:D-glycero-D-manno-heptose 1,7-bisphosphate phosphatase